MKNCGLIAGLIYPAKAIIFFWRYPFLWSYIIPPILLNFLIAIAIYSGLFFFAWEPLKSSQTDLIAWVDQIVLDLPYWLSFLSYIFVFLLNLLQIMLFAGAFVITGVAIAQFGVLLGAPWYGKLSEQIEKLCTGRVNIVEVNFVQELGRAILYELKKIVLMILALIILGVTNFLPGLGTTIFTLGWFIITTTIVGLDFLDSSLERRRLSFRRKLSILYSNLPASGSFALACLILITVPLINLLTIPLCVAAGTIFSCDRVIVNL